MQYRYIERLNERVSAFGMGCMRLPLLPDANGDSTRIDEQAAIEMIRYAIDNGVNYIDTAYTYHGECSEVVLGKALASGGYRDRTLVATKFPALMMAYHRYDELKANPRTVVERIVDEQLRRLGTDHIDMYLIHNLEKVRWPRLRDVDILNELQYIRDKGKIRFIGFSFHDELELFKSIVDYFDWDMVQIQLNILDENYQAGVTGLKYANSKGIPVTIMEPLRGGSLVNNIPHEAAEVYQQHHPNRSPAEWCFRWVSNFPEVMTVLSGVSTMEQTRQNIESFKDIMPNAMSAEELAVIRKVQDIYRSRIKVSCTSCSYCMPCPSGVNIPGIFGIYNNASMFNNFTRGSREYAGQISKKTDSSQCVRCGSCEAQCPQGIAIMNMLAEAHATLLPK